MWKENVNKSLNFFAVEKLNIAFLASFWYNWDNFLLKDFAFNWQMGLLSI